MRKSLVLSMVLALAGCQMSHDAARSLKYAGFVPVVFGAGLIAEPVFNGDGLQPHVTEAGVTCALVGIAISVLGLASDPESK